jgi:predicted phage terminase large subunit-like protein
MKHESRVLIRSDFRSFVRKAFYTRHKKLLGKEPYLDLLAIELSRVARGETKRLLINLPPRHLKTFLASICLPAWMLAQNPSARILVLTYNGDLAERITYEIREIIQASWFSDIFKTRIAKDRSRADDFDTEQGGGVFATSVGGPLAGRGADLIIFDDPMNLGSANNLKHIDFINQQFDSQIISRLNNPIDGRIVVIAHRLNKNDLSAHLSKQGHWRHVVLPLVAERKRSYDLEGKLWVRKRGELLRPNSHTVEELKRLARSENPDFELYYQQGQSNARRLDIKRKYFVPFDAPLPEGVPVILSIDPGQRGGPRNSFNVIQAWMPIAGHHLLIEQWREQCAFDGLRGAYRHFKRRHRAVVALIEATADGPALAAFAKGKQSIRVVDVIPDNRSKQARLLRHISLIRSRRIHIPKSALWRDDYINEFVEFPSSKFDDQVDATTQYLDWISSNPIPEPAPPLGIAVAVGSNGVLNPPAKCNGTKLPRGVVVLGRRRKN